tara:strand:- start:17058 stop:18056 length:999 start_codon:yes stop_codon:yes gene_type:complete
MPLTSSDLLRAVRSEFVNTYSGAAKASVNLQRVMRLGLSSTLREEYYGYHESTPGLERQDRGDEMSEDEILSRAFSCVNHRFSKAIGWHNDDVEDMQLGGFLERARQIAMKAGILSERIFFQILLAAANPSLLETVPNAPDGAALFAATAGGADRFGVSGGNIITGTGVGSSAAIRTDFWSAMTRFGLFTDTEGEPLLEDELDGTITVIAPRSASEKFTEAFKQETTVHVIQNVGATENVAAAGVTNNIRSGNLNVNLWLTQRRTDNDWSIHIDSPTVPKPVFEQIRQQIRVIEDNRNNSPHARRNFRSAVVADMRAGYGVGPAYGAVLVNN